MLTDRTGSTSVWTTGGFLFITLEDYYSSDKGRGWIIGIKVKTGSPHCILQWVGSFPGYIYVTYFGMATIRDLIELPSNNKQSTDFQESISFQTLILLQK